MEVQFIFWQWAPSYPCTCFYGASARHGRQQFRKRRPSSVGWGDGGSGPIPFWPNHSGPTPVGPVRSNLWTVLALLIFSRIIWKLRTLNIFSQANKFIVTKKVNKKIWQHIYILSHTLTTVFVLSRISAFLLFYQNCSNKRIDYLKIIYLQQHRRSGTSLRIIPKIFTCYIAGPPPPLHT